jgi:hypothetical protein
MRREPFGLRHMPVEHRRDAGIGHAAGLGERPPVAVANAGRPEQAAPAS